MIVPLLVFLFLGLPFLAIIWGVIYVLYCVCRYDVWLKTGVDDDV